mmetsp:Transcript_20779/g.45754  ORF Transcript_20779/g.45754 Transcript_20779/m.45754 type:complete len:313 (+) Transcript_20779:70-1008(+)
MAIDSMDAGWLSDVPAAALLRALNSSMWNITLLLSDGSIQAFGATSRGVHDCVLPASKHLTWRDQLQNKIGSLPFEFDFPLKPLEGQILQEMQALLTRLQLLRRRERAGVQAGWAPTLQECWRFQSSSELQELAATARSLTQDARKAGGVRTLLFGATLRADPDRSQERLCSTMPVGLEWVDGPAADALQLGLTLSLGSEAEVELEFTSGGWSDWAETWSLREGSLDACVIIAALQGGSARSIVRRPRGGINGAAGTLADLLEEGTASSSLKELLLTAGTEGIHAAVCIGGISWLKEPPPWCPWQIQQLCVA